MFSRLSWGAVQVTAICLWIPAGQLYITLDFSFRTRLWAVFKKKYILSRATNHRVPRYDGVRTWVEGLLARGDGTLAEACNLIIISKEHTSSC